MPRTRKGRAVNGVLILDKPQGMSSNHALQRAKRLFQAAKAGHTGSLDPLATGVLPLCFGEATKFSQYVLDADKAYCTRVVLGVGTDTLDAEGTVVQRVSAAHLQEADVMAVLPQFTGMIQQVPPMYSALKRDGQPLYKLARQGIEIERAARDVTLYDLRLLAFERGEHPVVELSLSCSKGTYVRSLAADLGAALGVPAHVATLRRTRAGPFTLDKAITLASLEQTAEVGLDALDALLGPVDQGISDLPRVDLSESASFYLRQGQAVRVPNAPQSGIVRLFAPGDVFWGIGDILDDGRVTPKRLVVR